MLVGIYYTLISSLLIVQIGINNLYLRDLGASGGVMVSNQNKLTSTNEFDSHFMPYSHGLVPHVSKSLLN